MKIKSLIKTIFIVVIILFPLKAYGQEKINAFEVEEKVKFNIQSNIENQLVMLDLSDIESTYDSYSDILSDITNGKSVKRFISEMTSGEADIEIKDVLTLIANLLFDEIDKNIPFMIMIIVIIALFSILNNLNVQSAETQVMVITIYVQYILIVSILTKVLISCFNLGAQTIGGLSDFTQSLFPVLAILTTSMGGIVSASVFTPIIAFLTSFITLMVKNTFMPMILVMLVFSILGNISDKVKISNFSKLIKSVFKWGLGIIFVIFLGVIKIKGLVGSTFDGVSIKVTKYTISKLVPYVGGAISDTVDTVAVCSLLLKNAIGITGLIIMFVIILKPVLNIAGCNVLIRLASSVLQPIAQKRVISLLDDFSDILTYLLILVIIVGAMFFITIGLIISTGNMNIMIR